jgi:hypothetical protein
MITAVGVDAVQRADEAGREPVTTGRISDDRYRAPVNTETSSAGVIRRYNGRRPTVSS